MDIPIDREEYENARHNNKKRGGTRCDTVAAKPI